MKRCLECGKQLPAHGPCPCRRKRVPATAAVAVGHPEPVPMGDTPVQKKRGRPPKYGVAMTMAERKNESRKNQQAEQDAADRKQLITELTEIYDRQASEVVVTGTDHDAIARANDRRGTERVQRGVYVESLKYLSLEELRRAREGKDLPDSHGTLPGETTGAFDHIKFEQQVIESERQQGGKTLIDVTAGVLNNPVGVPETIVITTRVEPTGTSPNPRNDKPGFEKGAPDRWRRLSAKELEKQNNVERKFREMAETIFRCERGEDILDESFHCRTPGCSFVANSFDAAVDHLWDEYYAGEKLWGHVDTLSDANALDSFGPGLEELLKETRRKAMANAHHYWICGWLSGTGSRGRPRKS
jgi:AT-hook transcription factor